MYATSRRGLVLVPIPSGAARQGQNGMGQVPQSHPAERNNPAPLHQPPGSPLQAGSPSEDYPGFLEIPAFYTVTVVLGGDPTLPSAVAADSVTLRPEPFVCRRITWATNGDTPIFISIPSIVGSAQGRSVRVEWQDEFTRFLGTKPCLVSALFGDSEGFLDFPRRGVLFQGKQTLSVRLTRILWPDPESQPADTEWDFNFQGVGLLPMNVNQSGSAG
jgi:hypothetical protein